MSARQNFEHVALDCAPHSWKLRKLMASPIQSLNTVIATLTLLAMCRACFSTIDCRTATPEATRALSLNHAFVGTRFTCSGTTDTQTRCLATRNSLSAITSFIILANKRGKSRKRDKLTVHYPSAQHNLNLSINIQTHARIYYRFLNPAFPSHPSHTHTA